MLTAGQAVAQSPGYYQTPALGPGSLVFASEGDLWRAAPEGGDALRLTTHPEAESMPVISPDGRWIAFEATYDGPREIYLMPITGGAPVRLTHEGGDVAVRGWLDNNRVIYRTSNIPGPVARLLRTVDRTSFRTEDIPLADAEQATLLSDGKTLAFTRYGLSVGGDNAVRYRGGRMGQLWRYTQGSNAEAVRLAADFGAPISSPMAWSGRIYFVSDKSGSDNIWSVNETGGDPRQHTQSTAWQMRTPYLYQGRIVYQSGADLYVFDIQSGVTSPISLRLASDDDSTRQRWLDTPLTFLEGAQFAPGGDAVTISARGRFVTAFIGSRRRVEFQVPDGARTRSAAIGADGKALYAIVDAGVHGEIWRFPADGRGESKALTSNSTAYIWELSPAPKGDSILYSDKRGKLFHLDAKTGRSTEIETTRSSSDAPFSSFEWSADGRYVAYAFVDARDITQVALYDTQTRQRTVMTSGKYESFSPALSLDGAWLYFLSDRNFQPNPDSPWGDRNMGPAFRSRTKLYALQLDPKATFPFKPDDELAPASDKDTDSKDGDDASSKGDAAKAADSKKPGDKSPGAKDDKQATIVLAGVQDRLWEVPVPPGDYSGLNVTKTHILVSERGDPGDDGASLKRVKITSKKPELKDFTGDVVRFALSADRSKLFIQQGDNAKAKFLIVDPAEDFPKELDESTIRISDWRLSVDPREEWRQMALDAWRLHRDFAYDSSLRGVNWNAVRDRFVPLAERVGHRAELNDLLGQMSAELGILHSQIRAGETPLDRESGVPAFLGATFEPAPGGLRIVSILNGERARPDTLGPLLKPGVGMQPGDIITAIDGAKVATAAVLDESLTQKAGQQVRIDFMRGAAQLSRIVVPATRSEQMTLLYADWVQHNREAVAAASGGKVGYLHLRAMGGADAASFARDYFEHFDKEGLIIDVRGNRGGNIDSWIIGTLLRRVWAFWPSPNGSGPASTNMQQTFRGHLAILIDEGTYSDGETFSAGVKALDIAPLIGVQTAGAGIWLSDRNPLIDGGQARVAENGQFGLDGRWLVEGRGVSPDILVENMPHAAYLGQDSQLEIALGYLRDKIAAEPVAPLTPKAYPPLGEYGADVR
ncbi:MAG: S41 family peptidase [Hyphomonadaceae bacterium]